MNYQLLQKLQGTLFFTVADLARAAGIQPAGAGDTGEPRISFDGAGNAIIVWPQSNGTSSSIWANIYVHGEGWDGAALLEVDDGDAINPQIAVDPSGNAVAIWQQATPTDSSSITVNHYISGTGWTGVLLLDEGNAETTNPQVALDPWGDGIAVWEQVSGSYKSIMASRYVSGTGWASPVLIEVNETGNALFPQIAMDTQGFGIAVWQHNDLSSGYRDIYAASYNCEGDSWNTPVLLENTNNNAGHQCPPLIAFDQNENAMAIWVQSDGVQNSLYFNRYLHSTNAWGTAGLVEETDANVLNQYAISFDLLGNAMVIWRHQGEVTDKINTNRFVFE